MDSINPELRRLYVEAAKRSYDFPFCGDNSISFDAKPKISVSEEGAWVSAWVWVSNEEVEKE